MLNRIKRAFSGSGFDDGSENEYLEIDVGGKEEKENKINVRLFTLKQYEDINAILNALREGYTIAIIDVKKLRQKDSLELKRAISKLKKTTDALEGSIKGFSNEQPDIIIVTPSFAKIEREPEKVDAQPQKSKFDMY